MAEEVAPKYNVELFPGEVIDLYNPDNPVVSEEDLRLGGENAAPEGAESKVAAESKETPEVKPVEPAAKTEEESLQTFKIKYKGEEKELKLSAEQLVERLQLAEHYNINMSKLAEDRQEVEPFKHILDTPWFKSKLEEGLADGSITKPADAPPPSAEDAYELERRKTDPDFATIQKAMHDWAITQPATIYNAVNTNVAVFNKEYDRAAAKLRAPKNTPPLNLTPKQEKQVDKVIQAKEKAKDSARIESPGSTSEISADKLRQNKLKDLKKAMKAGGPRSAEASAEYLLMTVFNQ